MGTVLAHDITEIRPGEFKGRAFKKGHVIRQEDVCHLQRLGKEHLFVLQVADDEMHENDAAYAIAQGAYGTTAWPSKASRKKARSASSLNVTGC